MVLLGSLGLDALDIATWLNPDGLHVASFGFLENHHVALSGWSVSLRYPSLLPINRLIPLLPSHFLIFSSLTLVVLRLV